MATYFFETITPTQAMGFDGQADHLVFSNPTSTAASIRVTFNPATASAPATLTMLDATDGHIVVFGTGLAGLLFPVLPNGSALGVSGLTGGQIFASPLGDGLFGLAGPDTLHGLGGDDVLQGGPGADVLDGGDGSDLFVIASGDSPAVAGQMDTVIDWSSSDRLGFAFKNGQLLAPSGNAINYVETTAGSFSAALTAANAQIAGGVVEYVSVQVGSDVIVFADDQGDHGAADDAVILRGHTLADIDASNIIPALVAPHAILLPPSPPPISPPPPPTSPPPPVTTPPVGHGATITVSGNADALGLTGDTDLPVVVASPTEFLLQSTAQSGGLTFHPQTFELLGSNFIYDSFGDPIGGTVQTVELAAGTPPGVPGGFDITVRGLSIPMSQLVTWAQNNDTASLTNALFGGDDLWNGSAGPDVMRGLTGNDTLMGLDGPDTLDGGAGSDLLIGGPGADLMTGGGGERDVFEIFGADSAPSSPDRITDWGSSDFLQFADGVPVTSSNYVEITAGSLDQAQSNAAFNRTSGIAYTVAQVGGDVVVFGGQTINGVVLAGRTLADISAANVGPDPSHPFADGPVSPPPPPPPPPTGSGGATVILADGVDMGTFQESMLSDAVVSTRSPTLEHLTFAGGAAQMSITGVGLTYDGNGILNGGTVTGVDITSPNGHFLLAGAHTDGSILGQAFLTNDANLSISNLLSGNDTITVAGSLPGADTSFTGLGFGGNDLMVGGGSLTTFFGGDGNDTLQGASAASTYLRGDAGDDSISGGTGFDDINGNMGADTLHGNAGDDWVVGGKDSDLQFGDAGDDIVWGNLGNDTLNGGDGNDQVRGGQGDDVLDGGAGNDFVSGDRGNDTITGGAGADLFHTFSGAGVDKVLDFHIAEGDRVMLDPGTTFNVTQVGADTVIDMGNGDEMILVGVQKSTLVGDWIFTGP